MALLTVRRRAELGTTCVLAPERYDPRRESLRTGSLVARAVPLASIVRSVRQVINPVRGKGGPRRYVVLDTSDVWEGLAIGRKIPVELADVGSSKKVFQRNDVLISRLRPYLRQVAYVDPGFAETALDAELLCSTEFFVLRSLDDQGIGFLVPYLLSPQVQGVLAASQEGGHHPRFDEDALLALPVPERLLAKRTETSEAVVRSASLYRESQDILTNLVGEAQDAMAPNPSSEKSAKKTRKH